MTVTSNNITTLCHSMLEDFQCLFNYEVFCSALTLLVIPADGHPVHKITYFRVFSGGTKTERKP